ncbi:Hypothetical protein IALB_1600 [Ignavibacterium album JCM 16511]|uniref:Uncharacterized protein n=1 Tax=Ignavibacterium album (strain DSM 19864 / JCM 16511 / NBRC 101810 / Mat9-16) TaxID=945713 RepID=I0AK01_IGNAJ|nr:Hypothetical protein IALB_1600 [Ignavibacterium album JCM 16511]
MKLNHRLHRLNTNSIYKIISLLKTHSSIQFYLPKLGTYPFFQLFIQSFKRNAII